MQELKEKFASLSEAEKMEFIKEIMPAISEMFQNNSQEMIRIMIPAFQKVMADSELDISQLMSMMGQLDMDTE
ncbi:hypothetical protein [Fuchsiella alkaliacetigena]|uniref:hypothetical protein n=1 Tax=Fuchsiella alkaliacetigena TaxID=957042 RepID=UPI00200A71B4|nr:hypothetical protein [Fuchsiella alkaliacetigena]MCK8824935.1 hypothetical protein [Fuchsiella alkaliacetigena]